MNMRKIEIRDEESVDAFLRGVRELWLRHPEKRFGEIVAEAYANRGLNGLYYAGDAELLGALRSSLGE